MINKKTFFGTYSVQGADRPAAAAAATNSHGPEVAVAVAVAVAGAGVGAGTMCNAFFFSPAGGAENMRENVLSQQRQPGDCGSTVQAGQPGQSASKLIFTTPDMGKTPKM